MIRYKFMFWQNQNCIVCKKDLKCREAAVIEQYYRATERSPGFFPRLPVFPAGPKDWKQRQSLNNNYYKYNSRSGPFSCVLSKMSPLRPSLAVWHNWKERLQFFPRPCPSTNPLLSWSPRQYLLAGNWGHPVHCSRRCTWPRTLCRRMWTTWTESEMITCLTLTKECTFINLRVLPSPDSEGFVGEGEGRFPLGGLSDTPDSLEETRRKKNLQTVN